MFKCLSPAALGLTASTNDLIEPVLSAGFQGLELDVVAFSEQVDRTDLPTARRLIDSARLKLGYFRLPFELGAEEADFQAGLKQLPVYARLAADLGCTRCLATIPPADDERPLHQNFVVFQQRITAVAQVLAQVDLQLGVGFSATQELRADRAFEFIRTFDALKLLLGMVAAKNVGVCADLYELWACGSSIEDVVASGMSVIVVFVADASADVSPDEALQAGRLLPGEGGAIDAANALRLLKDAGYDGPVVPLPHLSRFESLNRTAACKLAGEKLGELWTAAGLAKTKKSAVLQR